MTKKYEDDYGSKTLRIMSHIANELAELNNNIEKWRLKNEINR